MANAHDILATKGADIVTVGPAITVLEATKLMNEHKIGAVVVVKNRRVAGIFTERDVLRRVVAETLDPATTRVRDVMTDKVTCCYHDTTINEIRHMMKERKIRHVPVVDADGDLVGMLSIGDINAWSLRDGQVTIQYLNEFIFGRA